MSRWVRYRDSNHKPAVLISSIVSVGFGDRLLNEVKKIALKDVKLKIYAPPERKVSE